MKEVRLIRDFFTKNIALKILALTIALILWIISRYGLVK